MSNLAIADNVIDLKSYPMNGIDLTDPNNLGNDGFLKEHLHTLLILGGTFPFSGLISDLIKTEKVLLQELCVDGGMDVRSFRIFYALLKIARAELKLKFSIPISIRYENEISLMDMVGFSFHAETFAKYLKPIVTTYVSATRRGVVTEDSFKGKYFIYVKGRGRNDSFFYLNYPKLVDLGAKLGFISSNSNKHYANGKRTQIIPK